jgi:hypothetical protein
MPKYIRRFTFFKTGAIDSKYENPAAKMVARLE